MEAGHGDRDRVWGGVRTGTQRWEWDTRMGKSTGTGHGDSNGTEHRAARGQGRRNRTGYRGDRLDGPRDETRYRDRGRARDADIGTGMRRWDKASGQGHGHGRVQGQSTGPGTLRWDGDTDGKEYGDRARGQRWDRAWGWRCTDGKEHLGWDTGLGEYRDRAWGQRGDSTGRQGQRGGTRRGDSDKRDSRDFLLPRDLLRSLLAQGRGLALCVTDFTRRSMISSEASSGELGTSSWAGEPGLGVTCPVPAWGYEDAGISRVSPWAAPLCCPVPSPLLPRLARLRRAGTSVGKLRTLFMLSWPTSACSCCSGLADTTAGGAVASAMPENFSVCRWARGGRWGHGAALGALGGRGQRCSPVPR